MMAKNNRSAFEYGVWLVNYKIRSRKDLQYAMIKKGYPEDEVIEAMDNLDKCGYIDDQRYKELLVAQRKRNNVKGISFVKRELRMSGIDDFDDFDDLYSMEEELDIIQGLLLQWGFSAESDEKARNRFIGRLSRRGFNIGNIFDAMSMEQE